MSASTASLAPTNTNDASFRAWGSAISAALAAGGLIQTADTGQINWTTVTAPGAGNTAQGYEIWRSNDGGSGLNNWYMKIEYGSGAGATFPSIWITLGWSSNGSGTINSTNTTARTQLNCSNASGTASDCNFGVGTGWLAIVMWSSNTNCFSALSIERTRDKTGAEQDQLFVWATATSGAFFNKVLPMSGTIPTGGNAAPHGQRNINSGVAAFGSDFGISTIAPVKGAWLMEALNIFGADTTNFTAAQSQHTVQAYGATHTYILNSYNVAWASGYRLLSRYE